MKDVKEQKEKAIKYNLRDSNVLYWQTSSAWGMDVGPQLWNEFLTGMIDIFWDWYLDHCNEYSDDTYDHSSSCCFEEYVSEIMKEELTEYFDSED